MVKKPTPAAEIERYKRRFALRRAAEAAVWRALGLAFAPARPWARGRAPRPDRILAVERILRIGDTLVTRPALAALRAKFPGAEVAVVCRPELAAVCEADSLVDRVIVAPPGARGFLAAARECRAFGAAAAYVFAPDRWSPYLAWLAGAGDIIGYDYASRGVALTQRRRPPARANVPVFSYPANAAEIRAAEIWLGLVNAAEARPAAYPAFEPGEDARRRAAEFLASRGAAGKRPLVVLHAGAADASYLWYGERWLEVGRALLARGAAALAFTAGPGDASASALATGFDGAPAFAAALPLLETFALVAAADLVISLDTALVHVAATMGTPAVALYGPGDASMWRPLGVPYRVVVGDAPCRGCKAARCFQDRHYCMEAISAAAVIEAAVELMEETHP